MAKTLSPQLRAAGERRVIAALAQNPEQSYQDLALATNFARCTVFGIVRRLAAQGRIEKVTGKGQSPNRYLLT